MLILWILDESVSVTELEATDANADSDLLTMAQYKILKLLMVRKKDVMKRMSCNMITAYAAIRSTTLWKWGSVSPSTTTSFTLGNTTVQYEHNTVYM